MTRGILFMLVVSLTGLEWGSGQARITVAAFEYPPIYQNAAAKGLSCEIVVEAFHSVHIDVDLQFFPVKRMIQTVAAGEVVCGIGGRILFSEPGIREKVELGSITNYVSQVFVYDTRVLGRSFEYTSFNDLGRYTVGVLAGSGIMRFLETRSKLRLSPSPTHDASALQLHSHRIDLWAIVDLTGHMTLQSLFPKEIQYYRFTGPYENGDVSVVFSKLADPQGKYQRAFEEGLRRIKSDGTCMAVMQKYYREMGKVNPNALSLDMRK